MKAEFEQHTDARIRSQTGEAWKTRSATLRQVGSFGGSEMYKRFATTVVAIALLAVSCGSTPETIDVGQAANATQTTVGPTPSGEPSESVAQPSPVPGDDPEVDLGDYDFVNDSARLAKDLGILNTNDEFGEPIEVLCFSYLDPMFEAARVRAKTITLEERPDMLERAIAEFPSDLELVKDRLSLAIGRIESVTDDLPREAVPFAQQLVSVYLDQLERLEKNGRDHQDLADSAAAMLGLEEAPFLAYLEAAEGKCARPAPV